MATEITAWQTSNGELFLVEQDALDYEEYLGHKSQNFADLILEINQYLYNYSIKHPYTKEILQVIGIDSHSQFINTLIISTDFIDCDNFTEIRANALQNIANGYKVYNLIVPYWALKQQV